MIRVNLLPEEFRVVKKDPQHLRYLAYGVLGIGLFLLITAGLFVDFLIVSNKNAQIEREWKNIQPQFDELNKLRSEVEGNLRKEKDFVEQFITSDRPLTHLLTWASELLPETCWLQEMQLTRKKNGGDFLLKGLAFPSKENTSIAQIENYLQGIKEKMPDVKLSLMTTRQQMEGTDLTQFTANYRWGEGGKK